MNKPFLKVPHARSQKRLFVYYAVLALILVFFQLFFSTSASAFQIGDRVQATDNLNVRSCPFLWCDIIVVISAGGTGRIINGSYSGDNYTWWYIGWDNGFTGYSVQNYLTVIPGTLPGSFTLNQPSTSCNSTNPQISLSWGSSSGATSYKVYRNGAYYANAYTSLTYNNTSVISGTTYTYFIRASNSAGYRDSNTVTATAPNCVADPQITIGPSSLNFGSVQSGSCSSAQFAVQHVLNTGTASGTVTISPNPPFKVTSNGSFSLSNGQAVNVNVEFCPTDSGSFSGTAVISSNANQNINSVNLSGTGVIPSPTTGAIQVNAKLDGTSWSGSVNYSISGAQNFSGNTVPADFQSRPQGNYTLVYVSGGPANSTFSSITPSNSLTLNGGGTITFTLNFAEQTSNQSPVAKFTMTSGGQTAYENQTLNLTVSSGGTAQVSFSGSRSSDPDGSISSYLWKINGTQVSTSRDYSSSLGKGTHQVYLTVTDNQGAEGSVGASIVIEETTTSTTTTSTTSTTTSTISTTSTPTSTTTTSTTSTTTSTISTTSTPTSTTSTTTTTLPGTSTITSISVPGIKNGYLLGSSSEDRYEFTISSSSPFGITISLFSVNFDTLLTLHRSETGTKVVEDEDNGHLDWGQEEKEDVGTNSEISCELWSDTYTIGVTRSKNSKTQGGEYTLVVRAGNNAIETICDKIGHEFPAVFPGENWPDDPNDWVVEMKKITDTVTDTVRCVGRCGKGCPGDGIPACGNEYIYTRDCFNHDACCGYYGEADDGEGCWSDQCKHIDEECVNDCIFANPCAGPQYVNPSGICAGQTACYTTAQSAIDAGGDGSTIRLSTGIYSEHLTTTPKTMILWGGWDSTFTTDSSTSTVNSLTVTDGKVIVDNLVIQ